MTPLPSPVLLDTPGSTGLGPALLVYAVLHPQALMALTSCRHLATS